MILFGSSADSGSPHYIHTDYNADVNSSPTNDFRTVS